jgi:glycosidase
MDDFIFGTLATEERRLAHLRALRSGITHAQRRAPRDPLPGQAVSLELTLGPEHTHQQAWVYWTNDGSDPIGKNGQAQNGYATPLQPLDAEWDTLVWGYVRRFGGQIPGQRPGTVVRYRIAAGIPADEVYADEGAFYAYYVDNDPPPAWTRDAILYQIFADRFFDASPDFPIVEPKPSLKCNGTLRGITAKLDYIASLGVNCLWLTPIFPSPSYHGYDATSFYEINPRLGTKEDFRELLDEAHKRGIRLLMDFVPNHWSNQHPTFVEAQKDKQSPHFDWYTWKTWPHDYKTFFGVKTLPQINLRHPQAREHVLGAARYWLEFGVDGFRVDYCIGPTPDFYAEFRRVTRAANPESWTFGEAVDPPDSQITFEGGMDGALDFMLLEAIRQTFAFSRWKARRFADFLDRHETFFPATFSRPSFLDNHDMNRFLWVAGNDKRKLRLAALCQYTLAGAPIIYYGTEIGASQERDMIQNGRAIHEEGRLPMDWNESKQDLDLYAYYRELARLRHENPVLRRGGRETIYADDAVLAYRRFDADSALVTVLNVSPNPVTLTLPLAQGNSIRYATGFDCKAETTPEGLKVHLPGYGGALLG